METRSFFDLTLRLKGADRGFWARPSVLSCCDELPEAVSEPGKAALALLSSSGRQVTLECGLLMLGLRFLAAPAFPRGRNPCVVRACAALKRAFCNEQAPISLLRSSSASRRDRRPEPKARA